MIERRRNILKKVNALPFVVPENFDEAYLCRNGMVNIVDEFDADNSLTKRFSYAVHSCANSADGLEPLAEIGYEDKSIPTNPYPYFIVKPVIREEQPDGSFIVTHVRHYLPDIEGATYKVVEKLPSGSWNQLTIAIEDATCTYENPKGSGTWHTFNAYGYGRSYVDFTANSTHRYVVTYSASTEAKIPMDCVWFFLARCNSISTENYNLKGQNNTTVYLTRYNVVNYIHLREGLTVLNDRAFYGCASLKGDLVIPKGVKHVGSECFCNTTMNGALVIDGVESVGVGAFLQRAYTNAGFNPIYFSSVFISGTFNPVDASLDASLYNIPLITTSELSLTNFYYMYNGVLYYDDGNDRVCVCAPRTIQSDSGHIQDGTTVLMAAFHIRAEEFEVTFPNSICQLLRYSFYKCSGISGIFDFSSSNLESIGSFCFAHSNISTPIFGIGRFTQYLNLYLFGIRPEAYKVHSDNEFYFADADGVLYNKSKSTLVKFPVKTTEHAYIIPDNCVKIGSNAFDKIGSNLKSLILPANFTHFLSYNYIHSKHITELTIPSSCRIWTETSYFRYLTKLYSLSPFYVADLDARIIYNPVNLDNPHSGGAYYNVGLYYFPRELDRFYRYTHLNNFLQLPTIVSFSENSVNVPIFNSGNVKIQEYHVRSTSAPNPCRGSVIYNSKKVELHVPCDAEGCDGSDIGYNRGNSCWQTSPIFSDGVTYDLVRIHGRITSANVIPDRFVVTEVGNTIQYDYDDGNGEVTVNMYQFTSPVIDNGDGTIDYEVWVKLGKPYTLEFPNEANTVININVSSKDPSTGHDLEQDITI